MSQLDNILKRRGENSDFVTLICLLSDIKDELKLANAHLNIITEEEDPPREPTETL